MQERIAYQEHYAPGSMPIKADKLPTLKHVSDSLEVESAELMSCGRVYIDGQGRLFQDVRVYLKRADKKESDEGSSNGR